MHRSTACHEVDALLICNRIKPHTKFTGEVQSGLLKMLTVGLGKQAGAETYHRAVRTHSFDDLIREAANCVMSTVPVLGGIAILEGEQKGVVDLRAFPASQIMSEEPLWLQRAAGLMPRLPLEEIDLLIVNEIGKELSGTGLDTNVVGRKFHDHSSTDQDWCRTKLIHIRSLTPATSGNATGIGIAEFTLASAAAEVDWKKTAVNSITAGHPTAAMCPIVMETDREVVDAALNIVGPECRMVHITNTLALQRFWISESCVPQLQKQEPSARIAQDADYYSRQLTGFTA
ncbi:MAG: hypothetical protein KDA78_10265 [Planctomycetaceae bacterium]|nr:hypothetical protein [Planctomycetaceae bacterium]